MLTAAEVKVALRQRLYRVLLALGPGYLERTRTGTVQSTLVDGVEALEAYLGYYLPQSIVAVAVPLAVVAYICVLSPSGGRGRAGVRAGRSPGAAPVGRPAGRVRPAALAGVHGPQRPVRGQHAGNGHAEGAQRQRAPRAGPPERRARALPGDDGAARHLHDPQRRRGAGDERGRGDGRRRGRVPGGGRSSRPGGTPRGAVSHGGVLPSVGGAGLLLAQGLPGRVRLHGHLRAPGGKARGGRPRGRRRRTPSVREHAEFPRLRERHLCLPPGQRAGARRPVVQPWTQARALASSVSRGRGRAPWPRCCCGSSTPSRDAWRSAAWTSATTPWRRCEA